MDYIGKCTARGAASEKTKEVYLAAIATFLDFCGSSGCNPSYATEDDILNFRRNMVLAKFKPNTIMVRLAAVRTLYKALIKAGIRKDNPAIDVKAPKVDIKPVDMVLANLIYPDQMKLIHDKIKDDERGIRDKAILLVLYILGLRVAEAAALDYSSFKDDLVTFIAKGGISRTLSAPEPLNSALHKLKESISEGPLFLGFRKHRLSVRGIQKMVSSRLKAAGITHRGPHAFRHSCATVMAVAGVSPYAIQDHLGHASQKTTDIYTRVAGRLMDAPGNAVARSLGF